MTLTFHVADSLTGKIIGRLYPHRWEWTDPLAGSGSGRLYVPLPDPAKVEHLVSLTQPRRCWLAVEDEQGRFPFAGPFPRRPGREGGTVVVPVADWRLWLYRAFLRPGPNGESGDYVHTAPEIEQATAMTDLMARALDTTGAPCLVVDAAAATGITRQVTFRQLQTSVGDALDDIAARPDGAEWYTYVTRKAGDPTTLVPHVAVAWPERSSSRAPVFIEHRVEYAEGRGGNVHAYTWPEGPEAPSRVWALGEGEPPAQVYASDEIPDLGEGTDVAWEEVTGPHTGVTQAETAFEHAAARLDALSGLSGQATFTIAADRLPIGDVVTGDRARIVLADGWERVDLPAARIISRTVRGGVGAGQPLEQELTVDLGDHEQVGEDEPGEAGVDEEV